MGFFLRFIFIVSVHVGWVRVHECRCLQRPEVSDLTGSGVTDGCERLHVGAGHRTWIL